MALKAEDGKLRRHFPNNGERRVCIYIWENKFSWTHHQHDSTPEPLAPDPATMSYLETDITQSNCEIWICVGLGHVSKPEKEVKSIQASGTDIHLHSWGSPESLRLEIVNFLRNTGSLVMFLPCIQLTLFFSLMAVSSLICTVAQLVIPLNWITLYSETSPLEPLGKIHFQNPHPWYRSQSLPE